MEKLKVGVIGCGFIAKMKHIPAFKRMKKTVDLRAVCDINENLVKETAKEFHIAKAYTSTAMMFSEEDLDIVDICLPPQIHAPVAVEAMENGCNVITEKPMALKVSDCDQMVDVSQKQGVKMSVIHNVMYHPPFRKARELVAHGAIGNFVGMRIFLSTPRQEFLDVKDHWIHKLPGGVLGETGPHAAYLSLAFLNNIYNVDVYAKNFLTHPWAPFDDYTIELEGDTGRSSIVLSYTNNYFAAYIDIIGTNATLQLDVEKMLLIRQSLPDLKYISIARSSLSVISQMIGGTTLNVLNAITGRQKIGTEYIIEEFVKSILNGTAPPVTAEEGRETVRVMEMVVERYQTKYGNLSQ